MDCFSILLGTLLAVSGSYTLTPATSSGAGSPLRGQRPPSVISRAGVLLEDQGNPSGY